MYVFSELGKQNLDLQLTLLPIVTLRNLNISVTPAPIWYKVRNLGRAILLV